jgi:hypothetical protein
MKTGQRDLTTRAGATASVILALLLAYSCILQEAAGGRTAAIIGGAATSCGVTLATNTDPETLTRGR